MPVPDLEVVVVSYNVKGLLDACLASLFRCAEAEGLALRLWVVDNASHDGSADMVAARYPQAILTRNKDNKGFVGGVNQALTAIGYPDSPMSDAPVLVLNPDTEITPGALSLMLEDLRQLSRAAVIGPGLRYGDGSFQHSAFRFPGLAQAIIEFFPINWRLIESSLNGRYPTEGRCPWPYLVDHPLGAAMLLRPEAIEEAGLLDDGYFMYSEEIDWCWRLKQLGWEIWSDPRAIIVHHSGQSTRQRRQRMYLELWRSRFRFQQKNRGSLHAALLRPVVWLGMLRQCGWRLLYPCWGDDLGDEQAEHLQTCRAILRL